MTKVELIAGIADKLKEPKKTVTPIKVVKIPEGIVACLSVRHGRFSRFPNNLGIPVRNSGLKSNRQIAK